MLEPFLVFSGLPADKKIVKPPKISKKKRIRPAMTKMVGRRSLISLAGVVVEPKLKFGNPAQPGFSGIS